jgi:hypothetical protein
VRVENTEHNSSDKLDCWPVSAVQWAMANGRGWGSWKCSELNPLLYMCATTQDNAAAAHNDAECAVKWCRKKRAGELLAWAHEHGCPCTCEADAAAEAAESILQGLEQ